MPDGTIWNGLGRLRKDNTGYERHQTCCFRRRRRPRPPQRRHFVAPWLPSRATCERRNTEPFCSYAI